MLPVTTFVGPVSLTVPNLERSVRFYEDVLGFVLIKDSGETALLGAGDGLPLLELVEDPSAVKQSRRSPGLFHFAVLFPSRGTLGQALAHLTEAGWRLSGAGDHLVSEALYLDDPDGNGIELYADRPRETWQYRDGLVLMDTLPVDIPSLIAEGSREPEPWDGLPAGTKIGHVHLKVSDIAAAGIFYRDVIGFDLMAVMPQAQFVSAGGYHHHLGLNTWLSEGSPPPPSNAAGLRSFTINVPELVTLDEIKERLNDASVEVEPTEAGLEFKDPSDNRVCLRVNPH